MPDDLCTWCGLTPRRRTDRGIGTECEACSRYRRRHGTGRPEHLIRRHAERSAREANRNQQAPAGTDGHKP